MHYSQRAGQVKSAARTAGAAAPAASPLGERRGWKRASTSVRWRCRRSWPWCRTARRRWPRSPGCARPGWSRPTRPTASVPLRRPAALLGALVAVGRAVGGVVDRPVAQPGSRPAAPRPVRRRARARGRGAPGRRAVAADALPPRRNRHRHRARRRLTWRAPAGLSQYVSIRRFAAPRLNQIAVWLAILALPAARAPGLPRPDAPRARSPPR